jgi:hypothetical protein
MAIKLQPDNDGVLRVSIKNRVVEIETGNDWRGGFPSADADSDWRGGHPVFEVQPVLDDAQTRRVLDGLYEGGFAGLNAPDQVILRGIARFEPSSLVDLADTLDTKFSGAKLVLDFDSEAAK